MKGKFGSILVLLTIAFCVHAEMHTWTSKDGKTIEGEYVNLAFEKVTIKDAKGDLIQLPLNQLCDEDQLMVDYLNPPKLSIDYRESVQWKEFTADAWHPNGGGTVQNHPIKYTDATFGALVKQQSTKEYNHDLTLELYIFTAQYLDPDKYHIIGKAISNPFRLTKQNKFRFVFDTPNTYRIMYYNLYSQYPRGEKPSKYLALIKDERGEIIAYNANSEWLHKYFDALEKLPVGAWINDKCVRVHPTSPPRTRRDGM